MIDTKNIEPIDATYVYIHNDKKYTDCFESSMLRYLHLIFKKKRELKIDLELLKKYGAIPCLLDFFQKYKDIYPKNTYYMSKKGQEQRIEWCELLNSNKTFDYVNKDYELKSCLKNIYIFFDIFIPLYRFNHKYTTMTEMNVDCSIYPKCKGEKILITDTIFFHPKYIWVLTQFFEPNRVMRITGHSQIYFY